jgi:hypothetical protein
MGMKKVLKRAKDNRESAVTDAKEDNVLAGTGGAVHGHGLSGQEQHDLNWANKNAAEHSAKEMGQELDNMAKKLTTLNKNSLA